MFAKIPDFVFVVAFIIIVGVLRALLSAMLTPGAGAQRANGDARVRPPTEDKNQELDRFLADLGVKPRQSEVERIPPSVERRQEPRTQPKRKKPPKPERPRKPVERLSERHLKGSIEERHLQPSHSQLEAQRIEVLALETALATARMPAREGSAARKVRAVAAASPIAMLRMGHGSGMRNAFILKELLGPPLALRDGDTPGTRAG